MAQDDGQERTQQATPKRLREAREKGQIPRSREFNTMAMMLSAAAAFIFLGKKMINDLSDMLSHSFVIERENIFDVAAMANIFMDTLYEAILIVSPFLLVMLIVAVISSIAISGWNLSPQALAFKWDKLDPIKGLGRVFSMNGLVELIKALLKFSIIGAAAVALLLAKADEILGLGTKDISVAISDLGDLLVWLFLSISSTLILIAIIDVPFQIWNNAKQLKMTFQEIKDEMKQTEGNPEVKARIRQIQRELAQRRMMSEVPKADVIITNPTHYALALRYDQTKMQAPMLIAKGADLIAANIRSIAAANNIPIVNAPPLARALYYSTELEQEIPVGLFQAVAQVLAYVFHIKENGKNVDESKVLTDLPIPKALQRD